MVEVGTGTGLDPVESRSSSDVVQGGTVLDQVWGSTDTGLDSVWVVLVLVYMYCRVGGTDTGLVQVQAGTGTWLDPVHGGTGLVPVEGGIGL